MPVKEETLALFAIYLESRGYKHQYITSHMSAISFVHKLLNQSDHTHTFFVRKTLEGIKYLSNNSQTERLQPIDKFALYSIIDAIPFCLSCHYLRTLFKALFLLTYYTSLRCGEVVYTNTDKHTLRFNQIKKFEGAYFIKFLSYKYSAHCTQTFQLLPHQDLSNCPVQAMDNYLNKRGTSDGLLFITQNGKPINRSQFTKVLKQCLELTGLKGRYNTHSFRIGRTTELASRNFSEEIIRISGRWKSTAFRDYIRPKFVTLPQ